LAEDNYQQWKVYSYAVQCWTGSSWSAVLFNDTSTDVAKPRFDEHPISNPCTTNRLRVLFANPEGPVEVFEFEIYGSPTGSRTLTLDTTPNVCAVSPSKGSRTLPVGTSLAICAETCSGQVFERWSVTGNVWVQDPLEPCTEVRDLAGNGTVTAQYHPEFVDVTVLPHEHGYVQTGSYHVPYDTQLEFRVTPNPGYVVYGYFYPDMNSPGFDYDAETEIMTVPLRADGTISVNMGRLQTAITSVSRGNGDIHPGGGNMYDVGSDVTFNFTPAPGYRVSEVCPDRFSSCLPWSQNAYTLTNISEGVYDSWFWVGFEYANAQSRANTGQCLDAAGAGTSSGTQIQIGNCHAGGHPAQWYSLREAGNATYEIVNGGSNRCVDISGASTENGAKVQLWDCNGSNSQRFRVEDMGGGFSRLRNVNSNRCLDIAGGATQAGTRVHQWDCHGGFNQQWRLPR
jgi:hypothetical protein